MELEESQGIMNIDEQFENLPENPFADDDPAYKEEPL